MSGCRDCKKYKEQIKGLTEEIALIKFELEDYKSNRYKSKKKKPPKQDPPKPEPKKKGGLFGHTGWFRSAPKRIDKIEEVHLSKCPICGCKDITECKLERE